MDQRLQFHSSVATYIQMMTWHQQGLDHDQAHHKAKQLFLQINSWFFHLEKRVFTFVLLLLII